MADRVFGVFSLVHGKHLQPERYGARNLLQGTILSNLSAAARLYIYGLDTLLAFNAYI